MSKSLIPAGLVCWSICAATGRGAVTPVVGPINDPFGGDVIYVVPRSSWTAAEAAAVGLGGNLVTVHNATENAFLVSAVARDFSAVGGPNLSNVPLWIGFDDPTGVAADDGPAGTNSRHASDFRWVDGSPVAYTNWNTATNEPTDGGGNEYYTALDWHLAQSNLPAGTWNDVPLAGTTGFGGNSDGPYFGLVEVPVPEPTGVATVFAVAGLTARRRFRKRIR